MADRDGIGTQRADPILDERQPVGVAFAAQRRHVPAIEVARCKDRRVGVLHLLERKTLPGAIGDLAQAVIDGIIGGIKFQLAAQQFHGDAGAAKRARDIGQRRRIALLLLQQFAQQLAGGDRLLAAFVVEGNILGALKAPGSVPIGLAVADVIDRGHGQSACSKNGDARDQPGHAVFDREVD